MALPLNYSNCGMAWRNTALNYVLLDTISVTAVCFFKAVSFPSRKFALSDYP
jgi:hypothetical protein